MKRIDVLVPALVLIITSPHVLANVRTVALTGQQAPDMPAGVTFAGYFVNGVAQGYYAVGTYSFGPVINDAGQVAFSEGLVGDGIPPTGGGGIWSEGTGQLRLVARLGEHAPGAPIGATFSQLGNPSNNLGVAFLQLNNVGQTAFWASLGGTATGYGIWSEGSGSLAPVAITGDPAPGTPSGTVFSSTFFPAFYRAVLNNAGQIAFAARTSVAAAPLGIWSQGPGQLTLVARTGDPAPGLLSGVNFAMGEFPPSLNDAGQVAFFCGLTGTGVDSTNDRAIWSQGSGSLALVAREGDQAPGLPNGVTYGGSFGAPMLNNNGRIAFQTNLAGDDSIWSDVSGSMALLARSGHHAPGTPPGVTFSGQLEKWTPRLNNADQILFKASVIGDGVDSSNNVGVWSNVSGSLALVVRSGDAAPGLQDGAKFADIGNLETVPFLNDAGQVAFCATLAGDGVDSSNSQSIWASDRAGALQLIARAGDQLEVAPGDSRTISLLTFGHDSRVGESNRRSGPFNKLGQLVFAASFTDGSSGVFVSNAVAVPEPSSLLIFALAAAAIFFSRRPYSARHWSLATVIVAACATAPHVAHAITIDTVLVGNPGNAGAALSNGTFGAVPYNYRIGKFEVTNAQYVAFLNGVDPTGANTLELYHSSMSSNGSGGINLNSGAANGEKYETKSGRDNNPVVYVTWYNAIRFANWLHNGQGSGGTEDGAYTLLGGTPTPTNGTNITRNPGAKWFLPSEDEWFKAAYHKNDGVTDNYWTYPTSTDDIPYSDQPPGTDAPDSSNTMNWYKNDGIANGYDDGFAVIGSTGISDSQNYLSDVGAYPLSTSPYGTFDQGGNVWELVETRINTLPPTPVIRGGAWYHGFNSNPGNFRRFGSGAPFNVIGFRVASAIPEPSTTLLLVIGCLALLGRRGFVRAAAPAA